MRDVTIIEVGPRDGLQNEPGFIPTDKKLQLIRTLIEAGVNRLEATSYVHPQRVPQMADAAEIMGALSEEKGVSLSALVPNLKGFERARAHRLDEVNWVSAASETFNARNINQTVEENIRAFEQLVAKAKQEGIKVRFSIATSFGCPFEGRIDQEQVIRLVERALQAGADEIGIADTIGIAVPDQVFQLCSRVLQISGSVPIAVHLHDTRGLALANVYAAYSAGIRMFESAVGGLGGCPFAPGAAGNVATEDVVYLFERMKVRTGLDFSKLLDASELAVGLSQRKALGRIRLVEDKWNPTFHF
ncbi:hydroxymethylglutaryl-CoA lyase [Brevibacillus sp. H7]|jgi:hydroxymethylglutaryl-CoA lyase|uniref:hydroxymethylglutaryl-CoA lyase n=1 Tax=Brevibacillus sp. H7 TaxID=3349138 RepID=UPI00381EFFEE